MRVVMFYQSLVSDWNHGNAHFLRGVMAELQSREHDVVVYEPADGWSRTNLMAEQGRAAIDAFERRFPGLRSRIYRPGDLNLDEALRGVDVVLVHEWNEPALIAAIGAHRQRHGYQLLFHDTHHRVVSAPDDMAALCLDGYDAVLAFGASLRDLHAAQGRRAFTWHEAADIRVFTPQPPNETGDVVWIGNWGDDERASELDEFLIDPVRSLGLSATVYGVRYPEHARRQLAQAGITYGGWLANADVPAVFANFRLTVHVPRRPYTRALPGIPTIRPFEALACGIPLVSAPWDDRERLFKVGRDYLIARDGGEMKNQMAWLLTNREEGRAMARDGLRTILRRHTCGHRVDELLTIIQHLQHLIGRHPDGEVRAARPERHTRMA